MKNLIWSFGVAMVLFTTLFPSCVVGDDLNKFNPILTPQDEQALGDSLSAYIPQVYPVLNRTLYPSVYDYLDQSLGSISLITQMSSRYNWEFFVIQDDTDINAFVLPGGKLIVTTGMLKSIENDYELFALICHEISYTDREDRVTTESLSHIMSRFKASYSNGGTSIFIEVIEGNNSNAALAMVSQASSFAYDPEVVLAADEATQRLVCNYAYVPTGLYDLLYREFQEETSTTWLSNHPPALEPVDGFTLEGRLEQLDMLITPSCGGVFSNNEDFQNRIINKLP